MSTPLTDHVHGDAHVDAYELERVIQTFELVTGKLVPDDIEYYFYKAQTFTDPTHMAFPKDPNMVYIGLSYDDRVAGVHHRVIKVAMSYDDHTLNTPTHCVSATSIWHELTHTTMNDVRYGINDGKHKNLYWWDLDHGMVVNMVSVGLGMCAESERARLLNLEKQHTILVAQHTRYNRHKTFHGFTNQETKSH